MPFAARAGRGSAFCIGSARRRACKVGRPALDEDAIRWIEEHNPDIEFDWPKILEAKAPPAPPSDDVRARRGRRDKNERRRQPAAQKPASPRREPSEPDPAQAASVRTQNPWNRNLWNLEPLGTGTPPGTGTPGTPGTRIPGTVRTLRLLERRDLVEAFEQLTHPDAEETVEPPPMPARAVVRARAADTPARPICGAAGAHHRARRRSRAHRGASRPGRAVQSRYVGHRRGDSQRRRIVRAEDPRLRAALGLRRRRRSRRGGRRRRGAADGRDAPPTG